MGKAVRKPAPKRGRPPLPPEEGGKTSTCKGTYQITSGTDRFAGIKGSGSYTCKSYGSKGYYDWTETYTVA